MRANRSNGLGCAHAGLKRQQHQKRNSDSDSNARKNTTTTTKNNNNKVDIYNAQGEMGP